MFLNLVSFIAAMIVLAVSGYFSVRSLTRLALFLKTSTFILGFVIMGVLTSLPELFVSINAGLIKNSALALGNIIGANITDLALIGGITVLLARLVDVRGKVLQKNTTRMIYAVLLFLTLGFLGFIAALIWALASRRAENFCTRPAVSTTVCFPV